MSELTPCNYCSLQFMKKWAERRGASLIMTAEDDWIVVSYSDRPKEGSAWFKKITDHCVC